MVVEGGDILAGKDNVRECASDGLNGNRTVWSIVSIPFIPDALKECTLERISMASF